MSVDQLCLDRVLIVLGDPGSIKPILSWLTINKASINNFCVIARCDSTIIREFDFKVTIHDELSGIGFLDTFSPTFVLTGTSYPGNSFELRIIEACLQKNIFVIAYFDHWQNFVARFKLDKQLIFPNEIWLMDNKALEFAIKDGLSNNILKVVGNPYISLLIKWEPSLTKNNFLNLLGNTFPEKYILYLPDFISGSNESSDVYGFDEFSVLDAIIDFMKAGNYFQAQGLVVKIHPSHSYDIFYGHIQVFHSSLIDKIIILKDADIKHLAHYASLIIGLFSNALIEVKAINSSVIRYCPNLKIRDPLIHLNSSVAYSKEEFATLFKKHLKL